MDELHLKVYNNRSELVLPDGTIESFLEGGMSEAAKIRYKKIATELSNSYLERQILLCRNSSSNLDFSQLRRDMAPIDEPCYQWLLSLNEILKL